MTREKCHQHWRALFWSIERTQRGTECTLMAKNRSVYIYIHENRETYQFIPSNFSISSVRTLKRGNDAGSFQMDVWGRRNMKGQNYPWHFAMKMALRQENDLFLCWPTHCLLRIPLFGRKTCKQTRLRAPLVHHLCLENLLLCQKKELTFLRWGKQPPMVSLSMDFHCKALDFFFYNSVFPVMVVSHFRFW